MVMAVYNLRIQATVIELLQVIATRGEVDVATLETIEAAIISRLFAAVHTHHLDLQNKLLHVLHSVIFASTSMIQPERNVSRGSEKEKSTDQGASPYHGNPLLVQTLIDGLSAPTNRPVLQHWVDFVLMSVAQFQSLSHAIPPLCECLCKQLHKSLSDLQSVVVHNGKGKTSMASFATDAEIILLLNALERLVLLSISKTDESSPTEDEAGPSERGASDAPSGILGYVFGVDSSSSSTFHEEPLTVSLFL
jgi:protein dopey